jgi:hypothetical protein
MTYIPETVYLLCALASLACAILLARGYFRSKARILLWSTLSFVFLALNNLLLFLDLVVLPTVDLSPLRDLAGLIALAVLVFGLLWDAD